MILETFPVGLLQCNCSILGDEQTHEAIVVDPGDNVPEILRRLARHRLTLKQIVVTHAHIDHISGASVLREATGAPVILNDHDLPLARQMDVQAGWLGIKTPEMVIPDGAADDLMTVGTSLMIGTVLHTPGHTPGSICLLFSDQQLLFAGDTLFAGTIGRTDLPGGDSRQIVQSLRERLAPLPEATYVIPGHGVSTTIGRELETNPFLRPGVRF